MPPKHTLKRHRPLHKIRKDFGAEYSIEGVKVDQAICKVPLGNAAQHKISCTAQGSAAQQRTWFHQTLTTRQHFPFPGSITPPLVLASGGDFLAGGRSPPPVFGPIPRRDRVQKWGWGGGPGKALEGVQNFMC